MNRQRARDATGRLRIRLGVLGALAVVPSASHAQPMDLRWASQQSPHPGAPRAIGAYARGCLQGAVPLPLSGRGWEVIRPSRRRYFGHPSLVEYVRALAAQARKRRLPTLLVGDLALPRGGPTPTGHRSHQSGLDVDIWYTPPATFRGKLTEADREALPMVAVVDLAKGQLTAAWSKRVTELLSLAAADPRVDRIFVNPVVKRELCARLPRGTEWLRRVRPWWGHHDHFHVRLRCPQGSEDCEAQDPLPADDGCAGVAWWFSADARAARERRNQTPDGGVPAPAPLPAACEAVLEAAQSLRAR